MRYNLQYFGDAGAGTGEGGADPAAGAAPGTDPAAQSQQTPAIDYAKIQQMLEGTLAAKEDTALKAYFKQQGLSQDEMGQAIETFKSQKAAQQPDVSALQAQLTQAQSAIQQATINNAATLAAIGLGLDAKTTPYVLKMADLSAVMGADGKVNDKELTNALKKVLEDVPGLKPQHGQATGFVQIGAVGQPNPQSNVDSELDRIFGVKKERK